MVILPMLQHAAFTKLPWLDKLLEFPSAVIESFLERALNSEARDLRADERFQIQTAMKNYSEKRCEELLWRWWVKTLQQVPGDLRARRIFEKGIKTIQPWNRLATDVRIHALVEILAFTRVAVRAAKRELPELTHPTETKVAQMIEQES